MLIDAFVLLCWGVVVFCAGVAVGALTLYGHVMNTIAEYETELDEARKR